MKKIIFAAALALSSASAFSAPIFSFFVDGNTYTQDFVISNDSTAGEALESFTIDLTSTGKVFDISIGAPGVSYGVPFAATAGTDMTTGLLSSSVMDEGSFLTVSFADFNPAESFSWVIDIDGTSSSAVFGDDLIGAMISATFSNNTVVSGEVFAVAGNADAGQFVPTSVTNVSAPAALGLFLVMAGGLAFRRK